jgi:hypothetical protein
LTNHSLGGQKFNKTSDSLTHLAFERSEVQQVIGLVILIPIERGIGLVKICEGFGEGVT